MEGSRLGPYRLVSELGSGGMGRVYRAEVAESIPGLDPDRPVALKVIHAHLLETPGFFKRFLREADLGRTIEHENVVRTYDCDALLHEGVQQNFLVMEYVEGQTLRDLLEELDRVPEELCRHIGREVAKGLAAIHDAGVVHRDLKPENVLITPDHVVKVMDLGVARLTDEAIRLSQAGAFVGSLEYAAPEQFRSADVDPDGRADLHALGVLLYELSTGQHPYRDEDAAKVLRNILDVSPRKVGEVNPQLSPFFEEVVESLIAKDRERRFAAAADLALILDEREESDWWKEKARALRLETKRPLRRIRIPRETALYGRDDDLEKLKSLYEGAKAGDGQVLLIEGEAGIGKTRLVDEFVGRLREEGEDVSFLFGSYPPGGAATAAGAFSTAFRAHFGSEGLEAALEDYLKPTPILIPAFAALLRGEVAPTDAEALTKDSLQTVFAHTTRALAAERPTIVLIDDLHFAPEDGRALFTSLALAVPGHRILLLGTMRPGVPEEWTAGITRLEHAEQRALARLGPKDLAKLLGDAFRSERLALKLAGQIGAKSDGNPFFAFEIIRGLREGQFISQRPDGTWVTTKVIQEIQVPSSVLDLIQARLRDLDEEERELLDVAACFGFEFAPSLVAEVVGLRRIPALRAFGRLESRHRLVRSAGRRYAFDHHQVQETLYAALHDELREAYHAAIAEALERRAGAAHTDPKDLDGPLCVDLCEHYLKGARGEQALRYLDEARLHLEEGFLNDQAITLLDRVLEEPGLVEGERRVEVLLGKNDRLLLLGRRQAQETVLEEARTLAEALGNRGLVAKVGLRAGILLRVTGRMEEALTQFEESRTIAREIGSRRLEGRAVGNLGGVLLRLDRCDEAGTQFGRHLAIAREIGDRRLEVGAIAGLGGMFHRIDRYEEAREHYERSRALACEIGDRENEAVMSANLGSVCVNLGRYEEARAHLEQGLTTVREIGDRLNESSIVGSLGTLHYKLGRHEEARAFYEQNLTIDREIGHRLGECGTTANLGNVFSALGRYEEARAHLERSLAIAREAGNRKLEGAVIGSLGLVLSNLGRHDEARAHVEQQLATAREVGDRRSEGTANGTLGTMLLHCDRYAEARVHLEMSQAIAQDIGVREIEGVATQNLALLWLLLGAREVARDGLEAAMAIFRDMGVRTGEVQCLHGLATLAVEEGDVRHAEELATEILTQAQELSDPLVAAFALSTIGELRLRSGDVEGAREALEEAANRAGERSAPGLRVYALSLIACLPGEDADRALAALAEAGDAANRPDVRYRLWKATNDLTHLEEAKRLLDERVEHAPEAYRRSMLDNRRENREIAEAWRRYGGHSEAGADA